MRAIILAAGLGRRLAPMGWDQPKCLLPCPRGTLLDNAILASRAQGVREFVIVVGHRRELIEQAAARHPFAFEFVFNERFADTNTLQSLWLAGKHLSDDFLLLNGDVWFRPSVLEKLRDCAGCAIAVEKKPCDEEEVKVSVDASGRVTRIGKGLPPGGCVGEYVGIGKFEATFGRALAESLNQMQAATGGEKRFFESAIDPLLTRQVLTAVPIDPGEAIEIDTPEDFARAQRLWSV